MKYCPNCSSPLPDGSKFCSTCGATIEDTAEQAAPVQGFEQQSEIEVAPIISDQSYDQQYGTYEQPQAYDQQYGTYEQPQAYDQQYGAYNQQQTYDQQYGTYNQSQPYDQQYYNNYEQQPQNYVQSQPMQNFEQPQMPFEQPQDVQNPDYVNPASPQMPGVVPGKGGSTLIVPIILIILIIAVILIDVFWLFRDQIWGKKDDSSTAAVSYVTLDE